MKGHSYERVSQLLQTQCAHSSGEPDWDLDLGQEFDTWNFHGSQENLQLEETLVELWNSYSV